MSNNIFSYMKTGFKLFILSLLLGVIYMAISFLVGLMFGISIIAGLMLGGGFTFFVVLILVILWILGSLIIGGYLAEKLWKWD